jgi:glycine/D-amino acid oxidase-like deaminating enzyme
MYHWWRYIGALTAWHLIRAGIECILVDGRAIGWEAPVQAPRYCNMSWILPLHKLKKTIGEIEAFAPINFVVTAIDKLIHHE